VRPLVGCLDDPADIPDAISLHGWDLLLDIPRPNRPRRDELGGSCFCGAVTFSVRRPSEQDGLQEWVKGYTSRESGIIKPSC
jgi:hypothetical protein